MAPVTEIALFPLLPGLSTHDHSSAAHRLFVSALTTVTSQPGARRAIYGHSLENPSDLLLYVDWDRVEDHIAFTQTAAYAPMLKSLEPLFSGQGSIKHIAPRPFPAAPLSVNNSRVVEVLTAYFDKDVSEGEREAYARRWEEFSAKGLPEGSRGTAGGWSLESDIANPEKGGKESRIFVGFVSWESKEEHLEWRNSEAFKSNIHLLRDGPENLGAVHFKPEEVQPTA